MPKFEARLTLNCTPEEVFDFLIKPANITQVSPPDLEFAFVNPPEVLQLGSRFEFQLQRFGMVQKIMHEIIGWDRPRSFIEKQVQGPLKLWTHEHVFEPDGDGLVTVIDRIEFEPPGGIVGLVVTERKIRQSLDDGFQHRHELLRNIFEQT